MANLKMSDLTDGSTANSDDRIPAARSPFGSTTSRYITPAYINTYILPLDNTITGDWTFDSSLRVQTAGAVFDAASVIGHGGGDGTLHSHTASAGTITASTNYDEVVAENSGNAGITILSGNTSYGGLAFGDDGDNDIGYIKYNHNTNFMFIGANAGDDITIDGPNAFIGIGTNAPDGKLHLYWDDCTATAVAAGDDFIIENGTSAGMTIMTHNDQVASIYFGDEDDADVGGIRYNHSNNTIAWHTAGGETNTLLNATGLMLGRNAVATTLLQIGATSSGATAVAGSDELLIESSAHTGITIAGGTTSNCTLAFGDSADADTGYILYNHNTDMMALKVNGTERALITDDGFLQMDPAGTFANSGNDYHVLRNANNLSGAINTILLNGGASTDNTSSFLLSGSTGAADRIYIYGNGNVVNSNNSYGSLSDRKLKKNIVPANSQWDDIKRMKLRNFEFTDKPGKKQLGCVAQELKTVSPGLVFQTARPGHGDMVEAVNYSILYMKGLGALQEAIARIEDLEKDVKALK